MCTNAIKTSPDYLDAIVLRAKTHFHAKNFKEFKQDRRVARKLDPAVRGLDTEVNIYSYRRYCASEEARRPRASAFGGEGARSFPRFNPQECRKNFYEILEVGRKAKEDDIRKAFKKRALVLHPDKFANESKAVQDEKARLFNQLREAYDTLGDYFKRKEYDEELKRGW